ncbi:hypothetical protein KUTeg_016260 [Tegillarca granosa]|uniref:Uncharacterized protein n=1 Tax=Tegillarca granosa TaxID=220873 RepID=A0ABQ9EQM2_TEGGR|nr:hypothetical protein KUTeg_016260 [Tegillarca granosa]
MNQEADLHTVYIAVGVAGGVVFIIFISLLIAYFVWKHCHVSEEDIAIDLPTIRKQMTDIIVVINNSFTIIMVNNITTNVVNSITTIVVNSFIISMVNNITTDVVNSITTIMVNSFIISMVNNITTNVVNSITTIVVNSFTISMVNNITTNVVNSITTIVVNSFTIIMVHNITTNVINSITTIVASNSSKSSDGGYDGSGESKNLKDSEIKKEEIIPLIPKFPPPKIPSESDSNNDSGCQGNGGIPDEKRDEIDDYDVTSSGDVETYFKQAGSTFSTNRGGSSIGNKTDSIHYPVDRNKDSITNIQETVNQTSSEKEDKSVDDISVIEPYVKQTFDSEKNIPKLTDVSGNNKTGRLLTTVPVTLTTGTVLNMNQFVPQDSSAQSVDSYVQNTMENSAASIPNDYVRHEDAIYNYQGQGQADLSGYNSDLLISTSDSMNNYTSGGSIDNYVQQDYDGDGSNLCR